MIVTLLILSVISGVLLGKFFGEKQLLAKDLLVVSAGFLITICLTDVFPDIYSSSNHSIGLWVIGGVLLQMLLENMTKGFEHGHFHHHSDGRNILPLALMIGLFIHAFLEGIPLSAQEQVLSPFLLGIIVHNIPISFILGAFLVKNKRFSPSALLIISLFALASPLGFFFGNYFDLGNLEIYFLAIVGGIFLHISSVIIFESSKNHNVDWKKLGLVLLGIVLAMAGQFFHT